MAGVLYKSNKLQILLITVVCVGIYLGLRALPDSECAFLHFEGSQVTIDGAEFCATDNPIFLNLKRLAFPVEMQVMTDAPLRVGEEAFFRVSFATLAGKPILPQDLAITHTELLHLLVVDPSLNDYHHVHPEPDGLSGEWTFSLTPRQAGTFQLFAEMVPLRTQTQVVATGTFEVAGEAQAPVVATSLSEAIGEYRFDLAVDPGQPLTNVDNQLLLTVTRGDGKPVELELVMGAFAHMVAFDQDRDGYAHLHPKYTGYERSAEPRLAFVLNTAKTGYYRVWAQLKIGGEELFAPFDITVQ